MEIILNTNLFTYEEEEMVVPQLHSNFTEETVQFQEMHNKLNKGHRSGEEGTAFA
jgi:hypothetical protein